MAVTIANESGRGVSSIRPKGDWWYRELELVRRLSDLRQTVSDSVGDVMLPTVEWGAVRPAVETISILTHACIEELRKTPVTKIDVATDHCRSILALQQLAIDFYLHQTAMRGQRLADCAAGLNRLRALPNSDALLDNACEELVLRCGFQRAVLSRVEGSAWRPLVIHDRTEDAKPSWFSDWINQSVPLTHTAPEAELLVTRRPSLVVDTENAAVYRPLIVQAGNSRSYIVAPLIHGDDVVGFLHTDHHPMPRRVDDADREVLWAFADGLGHVYERTMLLERLRAQRDSMRELFYSAVDRIDDLCESGVEVARHGEYGDHGVAAGSGSMPPSQLTEREAEVFELMVTGATNQAIANRLVITEGTVKSHVKHILRKCGAVNRAQAIAWSLQDR